MADLAPRVKRQPEVLAPAGDPDCLRAALEAGADAVYFGLDHGFNARARARNFTLEELPGAVAAIHRSGARAYLTLNTLLFEGELPVVEDLLRRVAEAGVDALIVQDPGLALLARAVCPEMELHASTQMTISSAEAARLAQTLGISRIVCPRELSVTEVRELAEGTGLELEVFVAGALCVSWSGQCLSSEAWGGRSANRGQCAQACRLPYELIVDDRPWPLGDVQYLLSPRDLAGFRAVPDLMETGVHTLKIEGRQKGPAYVAAAVGAFRRWVDALCRPGGATGEDIERMSADLRDLALAYSRGFGDGFLAGSDHQTLVDGRSPRHRGILLGTVVAVEPKQVRVQPAESPVWPGQGSVSSALPALGGSVDSASGPAPAEPELRAGMGVVFDEGKPQDQEQGGPLFGFRREGRHLLLRFGRPGPDLDKVRQGARVFLTSDPELQSRAMRASEPEGRIPLRVRVRGRAGEPLEVEARAGGHTVVRKSLEPLGNARARGLDRPLLEEKLGAVGGTCLRLVELDLSELEPGLFLPVSRLKSLRRELVGELARRIEAGPRRDSSQEPQLPRLRAEARRQARAGAPGASGLVALCRQPGQLEAAIGCGLQEVELDWMEMVGLARAVARAREAGLKVTIATVRVQKPGEEGYDRRIAALDPDGVLVRHWAGVMVFRARAGNRPEVHGDFCLNVTNSLTGYHLLGLGLDTVTAAHDLDELQLMGLLDEFPAERLAVTVHHHIPTFHTEHCVYSALLSNGRDYRTCGRPCEKHRVCLRDRTGSRHPVIVDVECRNTVFNAAAQSAAFLVPRLVERGLRRFRLEFVRETEEQARNVIEAYRQLLSGSLTPAELVRRVRVHEQFGVTAGTMQVLLR
ncbi:MAG: U32 family peptidase [Armatimonadetes bacterium]|nr:U32 family peptidase [Armatimonadota bacterium]